MLASRLVSRAYQPSVAASASIAAWSNHQVRVGLPGPPLPVPCKVSAGLGPVWPVPAVWVPAVWSLRCAAPGGGGADGVAQVGAGLTVAGDLLEPGGDLVLAGVEPAAQAGDQAAEVVSGAGEFPGPAGEGGTGAGGGVHEDAAQPDRRVAFASGVADPERLVVFQDVPAA